MVDYVRAAATAKRLIEQNGRSVSLLKDNRTPDDSAQPWRGTSTAPTAPQDGDTQTAIGAFVPPRGTGLGQLAVALAGDTLKAFDKVCLIAASSVPGVDLEEFDRIVDGSVVWHIKLHELLKPGGVEIMWALGVAR